MPDETLKVRVQAEGKESIDAVNASIDRLNKSVASGVASSTETIGGLRARLKDLKKELEATDTASPLFREVQGQMVATKERIGELMQGTLTANARMKESYFQTGEEIRRNLLPVQEGLTKAVLENGEATKTVKQIYREARVENRMFRFALMEGMHAFDGLAGSIETFTGASESSKEHIEEFTKSIQSAGMAGLGMKFALEAIGGPMAAFAGPVGIAVFALAEFANIMRADKEGMDKLVESVEKLNLELGNIKPSDALSKHLKELRDLQSSTDGASFSVMDYVRGAIGGVGSYGAIVARAGIRGALENERGTLEKSVEVNKAAEERVKVLREELEIRRGSRDLTISDLETLRTTIQNQMGIVQGAEAQRKVELELVAINDEINKKRDEAAKKEEENEKKREEAARKARETETTALKQRVAYADFMAHTWQTAGGARAYDIQTGKGGLIQSNATIQARLAKDAMASIGGVRVREADGESMMNSIEKPMQLLNDYMKNGEWRDFFTVAESGFQSIGKSIQTDIHDKLVTAFDGANSLLQKFVVGALDAVTQIGTKLAETAGMAAILSFIPGISDAGGGFGGIFRHLLGFADGGWIPEPVVGMGRSGQLYTFGERGPEYVHSNSSMQSAMSSQRVASLMNEGNSTNAMRGIAREVSALRREMAAGQWRLKGADIVYATNKAQAQLAGYMK